MGEITIKAHLVILSDQIGRIPEEGSLLLMDMNETVRGGCALKRLIFPISPVGDRGEKYNMEGVH